MNTTGSVTLLHKLVTLQNLYSSFLSNNAQATKEGKPLPEQLSINLFKLIYLVNSNSLINKQFDILHIAHSFQVISNAALQNKSPYVPALSITDIIKIIIEVLGKDSIIIPQQSSSNKDKQLLRLSPQITLDFIKQNLGEIYVAYKKEALQQIEIFENDYKTSLKEIEMIEKGKFDEKLLLEEHLESVKLAALLKELLKLLLEKSTTTALLLKPALATPSTLLQTPASKKQASAPMTPQTAPPVMKSGTASTIASLAIATPSVTKLTVPATMVKEASTGVHRLTTRSLDRKIEVMETPLLKQKKPISKHTSEEEEEKQKILERIEDSLMSSDIETDQDKNSKNGHNVLVLEEPELESVKKEEEVDEDLEQDEIATKESSEEKEEASDDVEVDDKEVLESEEKDDVQDDVEEEQNIEKAEESSEEATGKDEEDEVEESESESESKEEEHAPTPEPVTPPKMKPETEEDEVDEEDDKPKTRLSAKKLLKTQGDQQLRKRKRSETPTTEPPLKPQQQTNKKFQTIALQMITQISAHRFASTFLQPVNPHDEPEYYTLIKEPQDLKTITREIKNGKIASFFQLERNLMLMFCNAIMYNETDSDISILTLEMMHECEELIETFKDYL